jgi:hypothetical protein
MFKKLNATTSRFRLSCKQIEGKAEGKNEVARNMLAKNIAPELIAEVTGLSMEEFRALQAGSSPVN